MEVLQRNLKNTRTNVVKFFFYNDCITLGFDKLFKAKFVAMAMLIMMVMVIVMVILQNVPSWLQLELARA